MAQLPDGGVLAADQAAERAAAGLWLPGDPVVVKAVVEEFMFGDSCVQIITGDRRRSTHFWVPTDQIEPRLAPAMAIEAALHADIPGYNVLDALKRAASPIWHWHRVPVTKP